MDKTEIENRITAIRAEMEQCKAAYAKLDGHLAECIHWIAAIDKKAADALAKEQEDKAKELADKEAAEKLLLKLEGESNATQEGEQPEGHTSQH